METTHSQRSDLATQPVARIKTGTGAHATLVLAARVSSSTAASFIVLVVALHLIKPELDPSWRFVSEYAIGAYGWIMTLAFLMLAISCASAFLVVRPYMTTVAGRTGAGLLLAVAAALAAAGMFVMDPITARPDELTRSGNLHGLSSMIGIPGLPIAALLITRSLRRNPAWRGGLVAIRVAAHLTWISLLIMFGAMGVMLSRSGGTFGPDVPIGWPNRLLIAAYAAWLIVIARSSLRERRSQ